MKELRLAYLYEKYVQKTCTYDELREWYSHFQDPEAKTFIEQLANDSWNNMDKISAEARDIDWDFMFTNIVKNDALSAMVIKTTPNRFTTRWKVAASVIIVLTIGAASYFGYTVNNSGPALSNNRGIKEVEIDIAPGQVGAVLTLANGEQVVLDSARNGVLTQQGGMNIVKENGQLNYVEGTDTEVVFNTMSTPKGRQFTLVLADGSKVWLNAASTITFPTSFPGGERKVSVTGEVYFDVAHNPSKPFYVAVNGIDIQALGTDFNINAYPDEKFLKTTLVQGKVLVNGGGSSATLRPGQQALTNNNLSDGGIKVIDADIEAVTAWKNGLFNFDHSDIHKILREFARWYDIEIEYVGEIHNKEFFGIISRNSTLASVLKALKAGGAGTNNYKIESKKLIVQSGGKE